MYSKILIPLDGSPISECSLEQLKTVAGKGGETEVIILRVVEPILSADAATWSQAGYSTVEVDNRNRADAADYVTQVAEKLISDGYPADAASKIYYSMYYAAQALLKSEGAGAGILQKMNLMLS